MLKAKYYNIGFISISIFILFYIFYNIYKPIDNYHSTRIYNLRAVPEVYRSSLLKKFIDKQYVKNSILILGDSQPNGHMYTTETIFSTLLEKKLNQKVINAAFQDESITDNLFALEYMKSEKMKFDTIIFNINHSHPKTTNHHRLDINNSIDYKIGILKNSKSFRDFPSKFNPKKNPEDDFYKYPKLPNYFDMPKESLQIYLRRVEKLIYFAKSISKHTLIYETPHCQEDVKRLKLNELTVSKLSNEVQNICAENNVTFLKPNITEKSYFRDIVHFNSKGHIEMSEILYNEIQKLY